LEFFWFSSKRAVSQQAVAQKIPKPERPLIGVKANLLLTHFGNLKWTHPYCTARKKAFFKVREFATTLICSAMAAQSVPSEEQGIKVAPLS